MTGMRFSYRSGTSFARGTTIDPLLDAEDVKVLYARWDNAWGEPLAFQGGEIAITCDMVMSVPVKTLVRIYGKQRADRFRQVAQEFQEV